MKSAAAKVENQPTPIVEAPINPAESTPAKPARMRLSPREMPLRVITFESVVEMTCRHCYLHKSFTVGQLTSEFGYTDRSIVELEETLVCTRTHCLGPLAIDLTLI